MPPSQTPAANSYGLGLSAILVGALLCGGYAFASITIPLMLIGVLFPMAIVLFALVTIYAGLRGSVIFRVLVLVVGSLVNLSAIWFVTFWSHWGLDSAMLYFRLGPVVVLETILGLSDQLQFSFGEVQDVVRGSGVVVTGWVLVVIWGIEALIIVAAAGYGLGIGRKKQHSVAGADIGADTGAALSKGVPLAGKLIVGTIRGLVPVAIVFGLVWVFT